jgi:hypothetical protein
LIFGWRYSAFVFGFVLTTFTIGFFLAGWLNLFLTTLTIFLIVFLTGLAGFLVIGFFIVGKVNPTAGVHVTPTSEKILVLT